MSKLGYTTEKYFIYRCDTKDCTFKTSDKQKMIEHIEKGKHCNMSKLIERCFKRGKK